MKYFRTLLKSNISINYCMSWQVIMPWQKLSNLIFAKSISGKNFGFVNKVFHSNFGIFYSSNCIFRFYQYHLTLIICRYVTVKDNNSFFDIVMALLQNSTLKVKMIFCLISWICIVSIMKQDLFEYFGMKLTIKW